MFCPNCGTNNPDNAVVCGNCGTPFNQGQPANVQPTYTAQPVYNQVGAPVSKKEYFKNMPSPKAKSLSLISLILAVVLVVSVAATYFVVTNTSLVDIPLIQMAAGSEIDDFEDRLDTIDDYSDRMDDEYDRIKDDLSDDEQEIMEDFIESYRDCADTFSVNNIKAVLNKYEDLSDIEAFEDMDMDIDELEEMNDIIGIFTLVPLCFLIFILIFAALGGFLKIRGLVITSLIFSILYTLILCGVLWCIILAVVHIALIVVLTKRNAEYKEYKKSFGM